MLSINDNIIHCIRDIFGQLKSPVIYGRDMSMLSDFHSPVHGMGAVLMHSDFPQIRCCENVYFLNIDEDWLGHYIDYADFLFSINYSYDLNPPYCDRVAKKFKYILKSGAKIFLVNPSSWSFCFDDYYERNFSLEREVKRFSIFKNEKIFVYENI